MEGKEIKDDWKSYDAYFNIKPHLYCRINTVMGVWKNIFNKYNLLRDCFRNELSWYVIKMKNLNFGKYLSRICWRELQRPNREHSWRKPELFPLNYSPFLETSLKTLIKNSITLHHFAYIKYLDDLEYINMYGNIFWQLNPPPSTHTSTQPPTCRAAKRTQGPVTYNGLIDQG